MKWKNLVRSSPLELAYFETTQRFIKVWATNPHESTTWLAVIKVLINLSIIVTAFVSEFSFSIQSQGDLFDAIQGIPPAVTKMVSWIKLVSLLPVRSKISAFSNNILNHLKKESKDDRKKVLIEKTCAFANLWPWVLLLFGMSTALSYVLMPLIHWSFECLCGECETRVALPFKAALPYKDMTRVTNKYLYGFICCVLGYSGLVAVLGYCIVDSGFMAYCKYLAVMTQCLEMDFEEAFKRHSGNSELVGGDSRALYFELSDLVRRQQLIYGYVKELNRLFKYQILVQLLQDGIVLGVVSVNLLLTPGISKAIYVTYVIACIVQPLSYCYGAECLHRCDLHLAETIYFLEWYKFDKKVKNLVLLALMRTQKGNVIDVPFFNPSLPLLTAIFKTSGSYIALLRNFV